MVTVAAHIVTNLNSGDNRNISPYDNAVVSITRFIADSSLSILGPRWSWGTIRTMNEEVRAYIHKRFDEIVSGICQAYGATYEIDMMKGYAPIINDEYVTRVVQETAKELYGEDILVRPRTLMAGDDFSAFGQIAPTAFFLIGSGSAEEGYEYLVHNPKFAANEDILPIGAEMFVACTLAARVLIPQSKEHRLVKPVLFLYINLWLAVCTCRCGIRSAGGSFFCPGIADAPRCYRCQNQDAAHYSGKAGLLPVKQKDPKRRCQGLDDGNQAAMKRRTVVGGHGHKEIGNPQLKYAQGQN